MIAVSTKHNGSIEFTQGRAVQRHHHHALIHARRNEHGLLHLQIHQRAPLGERKPLLQLFNLETNLIKQRKHLRTGHVFCHGGSHTQRIECAQGGISPLSQRLAATAALHLARDRLNQRTRLGKRDQCSQHEGPAGADPARQQRLLDISALHCCMLIIVKDER